MIGATVIMSLRTLKLEQILVIDIKQVHEKKYESFC